MGGRLRRSSFTSYGSQQACGTIPNVHEHDAEWQWNSVEYRLLLDHDPVVTGTVIAASAMMTPYLSVHADEPAGISRLTSRRVSH
jgi:hypothetical protein